MKKYLFLLCIVFSLFINTTIEGSENRIISLAPSQTEILYAMGLGDQIVGVSDYSDYPQEALKKQKIGDIELKIEKILSLSPTLIIDANSMNKNYEPLFKQLKLNYINFSISDLNDISLVALKIGKLLGEEEKSERFATAWQDSLDSVKLNKLARPVTFYAEIWGTPMQAAGNKSFISKIMENAGGKNVIESEIDYPIINKETIVELNPDVILLCYPIYPSQLEKTKQRPAWNFISAIKNTHIYSLDQDLFVRPGPRNLEGLKTVNKLFRKAIK